MAKLDDMLWRSWRRLVGRWSLQDPRPAAEVAPYTFFLPHEAEIDALAPGDLAKLTFRGWPRSREWDAERMWVTITRIAADGFEGELANEPWDIPQMRLGTKVRFHRHHIIAVEFEDDARRPRNLPERREYWDRCMVDAEVLDGTPVGYIYREEPDLADEGDEFPDSGWRVRADQRGLTDDEIDARRPCYVALGAVLNRDDSWLSLIDEPVGSSFMRDFESGRYVSRQGR